MSKCPNITPIIYCLQEKSRLFGLEGSAVYIISSLYVLNCSKYFLVHILRHFVAMSDKKDFELYQVFMHKLLCQNDKIFIMIFGLYLVFVCQNVPILPYCILLMY